MTGGVMIRESTRTMSASSGRWAPAAVVFDCDGTLVDSATTNYRAWRDA